MIILGKCPLAHHFSVNYHLVSFVNYHLMSFDLYAQTTLHHVSKHDLIKPVYRCEVQEIRRLNTIFSKSFYCNLQYYKRFLPKLWIFQCNGLRK